MITDRRKLTTKVALFGMCSLHFTIGPLESIQSDSRDLYSPYTENTPPKTRLYDVCTILLHGIAA